MDLKIYCTSISCNKWMKRTPQLLLYRPQLLLSWHWKYEELEWSMEHFFNISNETLNFFTLTSFVRINSRCLRMNWHNFWCQPDKEAPVGGTSWNDETISFIKLTYVYMFCSILQHSNKVRIFLHLKNTYQYSNWLRICRQRADESSRSECPDNIIFITTIIQIIEYAAKTEISINSRFLSKAVHVQSS